MRRFHAPMLAIAALSGLGGCASAIDPAGKLFSLITPYRIDVVQGNVVTKEQMASVQPGMTRAQVRDRLGSPLVRDVFHADRWDYLFTYRSPGLPDQRRSIVLHFDGEVLKRIEAGDLPSEREFVASISKFRGVVPARELELTEEQRRALPAAPKPEPTTAEPAPPARSYPPLER